MGERGRRCQPRKQHPGVQRPALTETGNNRRIRSSSSAAVTSGSKSGFWRTFNNPRYFINDINYAIEGILAVERWILSLLKQKF